MHLAAGYHLFKISFIIVYTCAAFECKTGYKLHTKDNSATVVHSFPLANPSLSNEWLRCLYQIDYKPKKYTHICLKHFLTGNFVTNSNDSKNRGNHHGCTKFLQKLYFVFQVFSRVFQAKFKKN